MEFHSDREEEEEEEEEEELEEEAEGLTITPGNYENSLITSNQSQAVAQNSNKGAVIRYKECRKNHAVGIGGHAVDGCGEFMASGAEGTLDALKCAACNCHRNFHRKENNNTNFPNYNYNYNPHPFEITTAAPPPPSPHPTSARVVYQQVPPVSMLTHHHHVFRGTPSSYQPYQQQQLALPSTVNTTLDVGGEDQYRGSGSSRKRYRTKFTQEQKEKMLGLAERLGWRIQKHDEAEIDRFCNENGVRRQVLKVWMHNNKHTLVRQPPLPRIR